MVLRLLFIVAALMACQKNSPVADVLDSGADKPEVAQFSRIFAKIIGRPPGNSEKTMASSMLALTYEEQVDALLTSEQFYREGFWSFHAHRLLLGGLESSDEVRDYRDREALKLNMNDVARADNYWDILTYREHYLPLGGLQLLACRDYLSNSCRRGLNCEQYLRAVLHPEFEHAQACKTSATFEQYPYDLSTIYRDRCCPALGEALATEDTELCNAANTGYQSLFAKSFCEVASMAVTDNTLCKDKDEEETGGKKEEKLPCDQLPVPEWNGDQFTIALNLYLRLRLQAADASYIEFAEKNSGRYSSSFLKVRLPESLQGVHASPLWLSTHYTSDNNQHLHRARIIYHSWFCEEISPNQAKTSNVPPDEDEIEKFAQYFRDDDQHAKGDNNCFGCHKMIQPLANYFDKMSIGMRYDDNNIPTIDAARFFQRRTSDETELRAGYYNLHARKFFPHGSVGGMAGLADLLSNLPKVKRCIVNHAWNKIFGCERGLSEEEVNNYVNFTSYSDLLSKLLKTEKARAYFITDNSGEWSGEQKLTDMITAERAKQQQDCEAVKAKYGTDSYNSIANNACHGCHNPLINENFFSESDNNIIIFEPKEEQLKTIYIRSNSTELGPMMPMGGFRGDNKNLARQAFKCFVEQKAEDMGITLPALKDASCAPEYQTMHEVVE